MKIGIIADTHLKDSGSSLSSFLASNFRDIDILIHAGDFTSTAVLETLKDFKNFYGVTGNNDSGFDEHLLKETEIISIEDVRIGIFHGHGEKKTTFARVLDRFSHDEVDIVIYGHSHQPVIMTKDGVLYINPGSPNMKRKERWYTYAILTLERELISAELKCFQNKLI